MDGLLFNGAKINKIQQIQPSFSFYAKNQRNPAVFRDFAGFWRGMGRITAIVVSAASLLGSPWR